jgi:hypothetical protein
VDANRLSQGQMIAAVSAILLFIFSFLPWFSISGVTLAGTASKNFSLWEAENPLDIYLLLVILVALVPAALALLGGGGDAPLAPFAITLLAGIGTLLIFYQLFDHDFFSGNFSIKIGMILGLISCAGITVGGYLSMQEDLGGERY